MINYYSFSTLTHKATPCPDFPAFGLFFFFCFQNYYFIYLVFSFRTGWCDFIIGKYTVEELLTNNLQAASYCTFWNTKFAPWSSRQYTIYEIEIEKERHLMSFSRKYKYMTTVILKNSRIIFLSFRNCTNVIIISY